MIQMIQWQMQTGDCRIIFIYCTVLYASSLLISMLQITTIHHLDAENKNSNARFFIYIYVAIICLMLGDLIRF